MSAITAIFTNHQSGNYFYGCSISCDTFQRLVVLTQFSDLQFEKKSGKSQRIVLGTSLGGLTDYNTGKQEILTFNQQELKNGWSFASEIDIHSLLINLLIHGLVFLRYLI